MKEILSKSKNWDNFRNHLRGLTNKEKGDAFELLAKYYFLTSPKYTSQLNQVWLLNEVPTKIRSKLNLPNPDEGIDLIAETKEGEYWSIQAKYRTDETSSLTHRELSTFGDLSFVICKNISFGLVCTTTERYTKLLKEQDKIGFLTAEIWRNLDKDFFSNVKSLIYNKPKRLKPLTPRKHQKRAIENSLKHYVGDKQSSGKMIMPCGAGKSLSAYWIANEIGSKKTIIAVPSLSLLSQTIDVWAREDKANNRERSWIAVASDESVAKVNKDELAFFTQDLGIPVKTDVDYITSWLKRKRKKDIIVFTTYQSGKVISEACKQAGINFDLGIFDEAHKTVGSKDKLFSYLLFDENIKVKNRLFMTATERRYAGKKDNIISMDDIDIYGETFELLSFKEALEYKPQILSDYKVITILVDESEIERLIQKNVFVTDDKLNPQKEIESDMLASAIALRKAMNKYPIKHAVSFHSSIRRSETFKSIQDSLTETFDTYGELETFHVNGKMTSGRRDKILREFSSTNRSLISNARCLTEGIDVKNIDCILFADPKRSTVDIVQAVGRAMRPADGKEYGYIVIPVINRGDKLEKTAFDDILMILRALASNDDRIVEYFRAKFNRERQYQGGGVEFDLDERIAERIDIDKFIESVETKCWKSLAKLSWRPFEEAREYVRELNLGSVFEWNEFRKSIKKPRDIPSNPNKIYKNRGWKSWGDWLGTGNIANRNRFFWDFNRARKYIHKLEITSYHEWREYCDSGKKLKEIPSNPNQVYEKNGWNDWGDWLGTGTIANYNRKFLSYNEAKKIVHGFNLLSNKGWREYCKSGKKPENIPYSPERTYKNRGWKGYGDWLGTYTIPDQYREYYSYETARKVVHQLNLKSQEEWIEYWRKNKPLELPAKPERTYKNRGWKGYGDWLGTGNIASINRFFWDFNKARKYIHKLEITSYKEWQEYCKKGEKPKEIPSNPNQVYENNGWKDWGDWLGTRRLSNWNKQFWSFNKAKEYIQRLKLKNCKEWREFCKSSQKPEKIPNAPDQKYKNTGWLSWGDWLGTNVISTQQREFLTYIKARNYVHNLKLKDVKEWQKYCKNGGKPFNIPVNPEKKYKGNGWINWGDFLGSEVIAPRHKEYLQFKEAKELIHKLSFKSNKEWRQYCKSGKKPDNIPSTPERIYKGKGWLNWKDWLGKE